MEATREMLLTFVWICGIYSAGCLATLFLATIGMVRRNRDSEESTKALGTIMVLWPISMVIYLAAKAVYAIRDFCTKRKAA